MMIYDKPKEAQLARIKEVYGFDPPKEHGFDAVESVNAMHDGRLKVFFGMGGNFLSAMPDTTFTAEAMRKMKLTVNVSTKLNRGHLITGEESIILPTFARSDKDAINGVPQMVSCENSMGVVQQSKGVLEPVSDNLMSESFIVCNLAKAVLGSKSYLPNAPRAGKFETADWGGKAAFNIAGLPEHKPQADEYYLTTIRSHDQFNTTIYGMEDRYRGIHNERRVIFMNPTDIANAGFKAGDKVDISSHYDGVERMARLFIIVSYDIPERNTAVYYPEGNVLIPLSSVADKSNTPTSKLVFVKIRKHVD
jgi:anaerobic selenocysteine-containing dehydrogenase